MSSIHACFVNVVTAQHAAGMLSAHTQKSVDTYGHSSESFLRGHSINHCLALPVRKSGSFEILANISLDACL